MRLKLSSWGQALGLLPVAIHLLVCLDYENLHTLLLKLFYFQVDILQN